MAKVSQWHRKIQYPIVSSHIPRFAGLFILGLTNLKAIAFLRWHLLRLSKEYKKTTSVTEVGGEEV